MKRLWSIPAGIVGLLLVYSGLYLWQPGGREGLLILTHVGFAAFAWLAVALALRVVRMFEPGMTSRRAWLLFGAGLTVLAISESLWLYVYFSGQPVAYPSLVDISWAIGFIPVLISLVLYYRALNVQLSLRRKLIVMAIYLGLLVTALVILLNYILSNPGHVAAMQILISAYYLIGDLGVAFIATLSLVYVGRGLVSRPWQYIVISILMFAVAGLAFSYGTWTELYVTGRNVLSGVVDVAYLVGYVLAAAGGYRQLTLSLPPES